MFFGQPEEFCRLVQEEFLARFNEVAIGIVWRSNPMGSKSKNRKSTCSGAEQKGEQAKINSPRTGCLNCQSPLEWQFAMIRVGSQRIGNAETTNGTRT